MDGPRPVEWRKSLILRLQHELAALVQDEMNPNQGSAEPQMLESTAKLAVRRLAKGR